MTEIATLRRALMGDMIARIAADSGWAGVIIHGAVRDSAALADIPLGVKALGTNPRKSTKHGHGIVDAGVEIDGVVFTPGRRVVADEDGVLVER